MNKDDKRLILIIEDSATNINMLVGTLKNEYRLGIAKSGSGAFDFLKSQTPDLILLDIMMPEMNGYEVCKRLKKNSKTQPIPVIFITALGDTDQKTEGFEVGAVDYITKPFHATEVRARIETHLKIHRMHLELDEKNRIIHKALGEKQRQLNTLIGNLPGMVYRCSSPEYIRLEFISDGCRLLTGYDPAYFMNQDQPHYEYLAIEEDRVQVQSEVMLALAEKQPFETTYRIRTRDNSEKWVWEQGCGVYNDKNELQGVEGVIFDVTQRKMEQLLLKRENQALKSRMLERDRFSGLVGRSPAMQDVYETIIRASAVEESVIIYGESGTGKELVARAIHDNSSRRDNKFIPVNCGAIPEQLFESEFFGHRKGAFSGANVDKKGYLEIADKGTLFLDELGEINNQVQVKLLRVMDGNGFIPVGGTKVKKPNIRFVAATNRNLSEMVQQGAIREDFYFRIHVIPIHLPPLKNRREDIPLLIHHFLNSYPDNRMLPVTDEIVDQLVAYHWPGNIRELQNVLYQYLTLGSLELSDMGKDKSDVLSQKLKTIMNDFEKRHIVQVLSKHGHHKGKTAKILGIDRKTLFRKIRQYNIGQ